MKRDLSRTLRFPKTGFVIRLATFQVLGRGRDHSAGAWGRLGVCGWLVVEET